MSTTLMNKERFNPSRLSNLAVWLDAADSTTITLSGSTTEVTQWKDKSSNTNNFSVQIVPPPQVPPMDTVTQTISGSSSYTTSALYTSTVAVSLSGAGGGAGAAAGGPGGGAKYTFANVPAGTTIQYTVGSPGLSGNAPGGGGGATTLTIGSNTITAGGGGSGIKLVQGNAATLPFGGAADTDGDAGFYYSANNTITTQTVPGFSHIVGGGAGVSSNGRILIVPLRTRFDSVGSGTFNISATIYSAIVTVNGPGGGGEFGGYGGSIVYTGTMPPGTYTWYVGNTGNGYVGGSGYKPGNDGPLVYAAASPFGGVQNAAGDAGFVFSDTTTTQVASGFTHTVGGGGGVGTGGRIRIDVPIAPLVTDNNPSIDPLTWTSPAYPSIVTIVLAGGGGGGGSSGTGSGGNGGGSGGKTTLVLTGVEPGTTFTYVVGSGGGGSQDLAPQAPTFSVDGPKMLDVNPQDNIVGGTAGVPGGGTSPGNGAGGGGYSSVSYTDPKLGAIVILVAGGGGGGAGYPYFSNGIQNEGGIGGNGGQTARTTVGGVGGTLDDFGVTAGPGEDGTTAWDDNMAGGSWNPMLTPKSNSNGGTPGVPDNGNNSGGSGGDGSISFSAEGVGNTADYNAGVNTFVPTETSTYIITVKGAGGGGGAGGQGVYTTTLTSGTGYICTVGDAGVEGIAGGASTVNNLSVNARTATLRAGGGGGGGTNGDGGGGSSALVFPSGDKLVGGGGGGGNGGGRGGGSDDAGTNGGLSDGGDGGGFASASLLSFTVTGAGAGAATPGSMSISYPQTNIVVPGAGSFTAPVSGDYTIIVNGAGGGKAGGQGVYTTNIASGTTFTYSVGAGGTGAISGGATLMSPFLLTGEPAVLKAGGGGGSNNIESPGSAGESVYGGGGGQPGVSGGVGFPGSGGSQNIAGVTPIVGGGSSGTGAVYFTVSYTTPTASPSLTVYTNSGVLFPSGYLAVSSKLPGLGSAKTLMAVYQCSGAAASMNIGLGSNVSGGSFGLCQTDRTLYSPYQYGSGYDLTFTPNNYTAQSYAFASFDATQTILSGMAGFDDTAMKSSAFENLIVDTSLILGRQLTGYPSGDFILYELISTSNALSASDRQEVEGYLAAKWGLILPSSHPYKNFQPSGEQWIPPALPTTISGLVSWLDMTIITQLTNNITDRAGGTFALQTPGGVGGNQFRLSNINNHPSLYFPGSNNNFVVKTLPATAEGSALFVLNITDTRLDLPILGWVTGGGNPPWGPVLTYTAPTLTLRNNYAPAAAVDKNPVTQSMNTGTNLVFFAWDHANFYLSVNGGIPVVGSIAVPGSGTTLYIGSNTGSGIIPTMNIGELVVYNQYFEQSERQLLEGYLAWKWNIVSTLPSSHPFSRESPIGATVSETSQLNIPAQIASLTTWMDAADTATIITTSISGVSGYVTSWADKSASTDILTPIDPMNTPRYMRTSGVTRPGVYFSDQQSLRGTVNSAMSGGTGTCFMVASIGTAGQVFTGGYAIGGELNYGKSFGFVSANNGIIAPFQGTDPQYGNTVKDREVELLAPTALFARLNTTLSEPVGDGSYDFQRPENVGTADLRGNPVLWQPSLPDPSPWLFGYTRDYPQPQDVYVHEFLCFSEYFNDSQRELVEGYLAWKWGIQSKLPAEHPYKTSRPQSA